QPRLHRRLYLVIDQPIIPKRPVSLSRKRAAHKRQELSHSSPTVPTKAAPADKHLGMAGFAKTEFLPPRVAVLTALVVLALVVTVYLFFFLTLPPLNIDHAGGVEGRYFVLSLPMAAIFIASMANDDLPRDVVAATAMTGSLLSGLGREAPGATSSP